MKLQNAVKKLIEEAGKFPQYNFREHMIRRIREDFPLQGKDGEVSSEKGREDFLKRSEVFLAQLKRMTTVASLYGEKDNGFIARNDNDNNTNNDDNVNNNNNTNNCK